MAQFPPYVNFFVAGPNGESLLVPHVVVELALRVKAGESVRCGGCYRWLDRHKPHAVASYQPTGEPEPTHAYVLCARCSKQARGDAKTQRALTDRIEAYLTGEVVK